MKAKKTVSMKALVILMAAVLLIGGAVGGTLAWLITSTDTVTNTFTVGDINITLNETVKKDGFTIVPGTEEKKDPVITVEAGSENCYVFVKIEEENITGTVDDVDVKFVDWTIADGWTQLTGVTGVYYRTYTVEGGATYDVLKGNVVSYSKDLTKAQLETLDGKTPKLSFTAYAVQMEGLADVAAAWAEVTP